MKLSQLQIRNFRGTRSANLLFPDHVVLIGDNNTGKSTVLEAINLVLGPNRLSRRPPINEHDFYAGRYLRSDDANQDDDDEYRIYIEATITGLSDEQRARFMDYIEWWNTEKNSLHLHPVERVDAGEIVAALRVAFVGEYVADEDDFEGKTYFARSLQESDNPKRFTRSDKHVCGFLYLRSLRTGRRALSLEHGSLLDIILSVKELRPRMWETTIAGLADFDVASDPELGISGVLESISAALTKYVPDEWGVNPRLRVSALTREHLRNVITAFIATGGEPHVAPYYRQGTGTINMLVLAMLSQIAEDRQVIFAMEEPEIAIPPYAQKRIVHELRSLSAQSIVTSHSPYVLEEFDPAETIVLTRDSDGRMNHAPVLASDDVKRRKHYRQNFRIRFCEALLSRRVLITEGATESSAFPAVSRRLAELDPSKYVSLEALGICTIDAGSDSNIAPLGKMYRSLGKEVYAACDRQSPETEANIKRQVDELFMHSEKGFEDFVTKNTTCDALRRFANSVTWPQHLLTKYQKPWSDSLLREAVGAYFRWRKGAGTIADFLTACEEDEIPLWIRNCCTTLRRLAQPAVGDSPNRTNDQ